MSYSIFAEHYDDTMGNMTDKIVFVKNLIQEYFTKAESVIEFASGTGTILKGLSPFYSTAGIELSPAMLSIASQKVPDADMRLGDMTTYTMNKTYDVALCLYDSINHLLNWTEWIALFNNAYNHVNNNGIFIFDINTMERLKWLAAQSHTFQPSKDELSIRITEHNNVYDWKITIPSTVDGKTSFKEETIQETSFPVEKISSALAPLFAIEAVIDPKGLSSDNPNWRPFFICRKTEIQVAKSQQ